MWDWLVNDMEIFYVIVGGGYCVWRFHLENQKHHKRQGRQEEVKTLRKSIFEVAEAVEKFALNFSKRHQSGMKPSERIVSPKMDEAVALNSV